MTKKQRKQRILTILREWEDVVRELHYAAIEATAVALDPGCRLLKAQDAIEDAFTDGVADDLHAANWLNWWRHENCFGNRGLSVSLDGWKYPRKITTLNQLADLILACQPR